MNPKLRRCHDAYPNIQPASSLKTHAPAATKTRTTYFQTRITMMFPTFIAVFRFIQTIVSILGLKADIQSLRQDIQGLRQDLAQKDGSMLNSSQISPQNPDGLRLESENSSDRELK